MLDPRTRIRVSTAHKSLIVNWREGVSIESRTGLEIQILFDRVVGDRLQLAYRFRRSGRRMLTSTPAMYREAIGRFYYAMYHGLRAAVYYMIAGDDFEV